MKRFQFRLAALLQLRESVCYERQSQLADSLRRLAAVQAELNQVDGRLLAAADKAPGQGGLQIERLQNAARCRANLHRRRAKLLKRRWALEGEVVAGRDALAVADRDLRALERFRDAQRLRHRLDDDRRLARELDELALRDLGGDPANS